MSEFQKFLVDVLAVSAPFMKSINHLHIKQTQTGDFVAAGPAMDRSVNIIAISKTDLPELKGVACLGSLSYLKQLLNSSFVGKSKTPVELDLTFSTASDRKTTALKSIKLDLPKKLEVFYQATDPFYGNVILPSRTKTLDWTVGFSVPKETVKEFKEIRTIQASAPSTQPEDIFSLGFKDGEIVAFMGSGSHQSNLTLSNEVEPISGSNSCSAFFLTDEFMRTLDLCQRYDAIWYLCDVAAKIEFETEIANYEIIMSAKKVQ